VAFIQQDRAKKSFLPILLSPLPSFETSALLSRIEPVIQGNSLKKIERSQVPTSVSNSIKKFCMAVRTLDVQWRGD
jgi:hypothetical protein